MRYGRTLIPLRFHVQAVRVPCTAMEPLYGYLTVFALTPITGRHLGKLALRLFGSRWTSAWDAWQWHWVLGFYLLACGEQPPFDGASHAYG